MLAIYTRLSINDDESNSIENQIREGKEYAYLNGIKEDQIFIYNEGEGVKGSQPINERPELNKLLDDIKNGKISILYVRKQSRISRKLKMFNDILEEMIKYKIKLYMGDRGLLDLDSPMTKMMLQIMAAFDEYAPNQQSKETIKSLQQNFEDGKAWGVLPYGYDTDENMIPYVVEEEKKVINRIFNEYLEGKSAFSIANDLNNDKIPTKKHRYDKPVKLKNKYTKKETSKETKKILWVEKTIKGILKNTWYNGYRTYKGQTKETPRIVEKKIFEKVQKTIISRKGKRTSTPKYNYLLKGLIRCGVCERNYYGRFRPSKKDNFYMCSSKRNSLTNCGNNSINIPKIDSFIIKHLFKSKDLREMIYKIENDDKLLSEIKSELKVTRDELRKAQKKRDNYVELLGGELENNQSIINALIKTENVIIKLEDRVDKLFIKENELNNSQILKNYDLQLKMVNENFEFKTIQYAVNNIIENIILKNEMTEYGENLLFIQIEYKGLDEYSIFVTKKPYTFWMFYYNQRESNQKEKKEQIKDEIELLEFLTKKKLSGKELKDISTNIINKDDFYVVNRWGIDDVKINKDEIIEFNKCI